MEIHQDCGIMMVVSLCLSWQQPLERGFNHYYFSDARMSGYDSMGQTAANHHAYNP